MAIRHLPELPPPVSAERIEALALDLSDLPLLKQPADLERLSADFHDYSPLLEPLLAGRRAQLAVRAESRDQVCRIASACARHGVPLTLRGAGTGNYGQCVPLRGGVVLDLSGLRQVRSVDPHTGVVTAEAGITLVELDRQLAPLGRALRLAPSTYRSSTLGGFIAGGSGGVGSLRWGFLRDPGNLLGLEVVTVEPEPRLLQLDGLASDALNHAYGTNGILTALTLPTCEAVAWQQLVVGFESWDGALMAMQELGASALLLNNVALLEAPLLEAMPWPQGCPAPLPGEHRLLLLAAPDTLTLLPGWLAARGGRLLWTEAQGQGRGLPLRELCWNHTTLHWRGSHSGWTYLQMLLPEDPKPALAGLQQRWGDGLLWHLELVRHQGAARLAALPPVRFQGGPELEALIAHCRDLGIFVFDPHEISVEDGGSGQVEPSQVAAKRDHDPAGLLNPGKLRGWLEYRASLGPTG